MQEVCLLEHPDVNIYIFNIDFYYICIYSLFLFDLKITLNFCITIGIFIDYFKIICIEKLFSIQIVKGAQNMCKGGQVC